MDRRSTRRTSTISKEGDHNSDISRKHVLVDHTHIPAGPNLKKSRPGPLPASSRLSLRRPQSARSTPENDQGDSSINNDSLTHVPTTEKYPTPPTSSDQSSEASPEATAAADRLVSCEETIPQTTLRDQKDHPKEEEQITAFTTQERKENRFLQTEALFQPTHLSTDSTNIQGSPAQDDEYPRPVELSTAVLDDETCNIVSIEGAVCNPDPDCDEDRSMEFQDCKDDFPTADEIEGWDDIEDVFGEIPEIREETVPESACPICGIDFSTLTIMVCGSLSSNFLGHFFEQSD
jgi:hypothetical protein